MCCFIASQVTKCQSTFSTPFTWIYRELNKTHSHNNSRGSKKSQLISKWLVDEHFSKTLLAQVDWAHFNAECRVFFSLHRKGDGIFHTNFKLNLLLLLFFTLILLLFFRYVRFFCDLNLTLTKVKAQKKSIENDDKLHIKLRLGY